MGMPRSWNKIWSFRLAVFLLIGLLPAGWGYAQKLTVRTEKAPHHVGEPIAIEVDSIDFDSQPEIKIVGSEQKGVTLKFRNSGRSESTQIFQSGGKLVRKRTVKTTFYYQVTFEAAGEYQIGPFETVENGKPIAHPAIRFSVEDVPVSENMRVEIILPTGNLYPGQKVPVELRWLFAGDSRVVRGLTIRSELFDRYRFIDDAPRQQRNTLPVTTAKGILNFPAEFSKQEIDGKEFLVASVKRTMVPDRPEKVELPPTFVSFQKIVGTTRSNDIFDSFFDARPETTPMRGVGSPVQFEVKPFPIDNQPSSFRGAVGQDYRVSTSINRTSLRTGDPLTLQVNIEGKGNLGSIGAPDLSLSFSKSDFEWPAGENAGVTNGEQKQFLISFKVKNENVVEIPRLEFSWFNPEREEYQTVSSTPIPIDVKPGEVVSSRDVISSNRGGGQSMKEADDNSVTQIDLSIETDLKKLIRNEQSKQFLSWGMYGLGFISIGLFWMVDRAKRKPDIHHVRRRSIQSCCQQISRLSLGENFSSELGATLRELQTLVRENCSGRKSRELLADGEFSEELDQLISQCDAMAFRPNPPTTDEQRNLLTSARSLVARI